jgi:hypothetical protein
VADPDKLSGVLLLNPVTQGDDFFAEQFDQKRRRLKRTPVYPDWLGRDNVVG